MLFINTVLLLILTAYQHPVGRGIEMLVAEAIIKAGKHLKLLEYLGPNNVEKYTNLDDSILTKVGAYFDFYILYI